MEKTSKSFSDRVCEVPGGEHLKKCYSCGTCVSRCMVQDRIDPAYNPRRLIKKAALDMEGEALSDITPWLCSACDLCFPSCPQKIHISELLSAIRKLALDTGRSSPLRPAVVDGQTCTACGLCASICPYEAIHLGREKVLGQERLVAVVDGALCMGCGLCGAHCRSSSIGPAEPFSNESLLEDLWKGLRP